MGFKQNSCTLWEIFWIHVHMRLRDYCTWVAGGLICILHRGWFLQNKENKGLYADIDIDVVTVS